MNLEITPYTNIGPIEFGMTKDAVRSVIKSEFRIPKNNTSVDHFLDEAIRVHYDSEGLVDAVEVYGSANPVYLGAELLKLNIAELESYLLDNDGELKKDSNGFKSNKLGIGIYIPSMLDTSEEANVEGVIVFKKDYYN